MTTATSRTGLAFRHFILTRFWFALGPGGVISAVDDSLTAWLDHRLKLFEAYCLPSVIAQSCQDFRWLIYFDSRTPADFIARINKLVESSENIEILLVDAWGAPGHVSPFKDAPPRRYEVMEDLERRVVGQTEWVLTTRFDTDDGLHRDFVRRLHDAVEPRDEFLNFPNGILAHDRQTYLYAHPSNAFISLFERVAGMKSVICAPHDRVGEVGPVRQLAPFPAFLQVVHGTNDSNKPRGFRVHKILALQGFEAVKMLFQPPLEESNAEILLNNAVWSSYWSGRDQIVAQAKSLRGLFTKTVRSG